MFSHYGMFICNYQDVLVWNSNHLSCIFMHLSCIFMHLSWKPESSTGIYIPQKFPTSIVTIMPWSTSEALGAHIDRKSWDRIWPGTFFLYQVLKPRLSRCENTYGPGQPRVRRYVSCALHDWSLTRGSSFLPFFPFFFLKKISLFLV